MGGFGCGGREGGLGWGLSRLLRDVKVVGFCSVFFYPRFFGFVTPM